MTRRKGGEGGLEIDVDQEESAVDDTDKRRRSRVSVVARYLSDLDSLSWQSSSHFQGDVCFVSLIPLRGSLEDAARGSVGEDAGPILQSIGMLANMGVAWRGF